MQGLLVLTGRELSRFRKCEAVIEKGLETFRDVGGALLEIKEQALYRSDYTTFAEYCQKRWGFSDRHARQLISDAKTVATLDRKNSSEILTQSQATELGKVPAEDRKKVLDWATEKADGAPLTAKAIKEAAAEVLKDEPEEEEEADKPPKPTTAKGMDELESFVRKWIAKHKHPIGLATAMLESLASKLRNEQ